MTIIREWTATLPNGMTVKFTVPYYDDLLPSNNPNGCLTRDLECHALWQYYGAAMQSYDRAKKNFVEESELSLVFDEKMARDLFISIANSHGVSPHRMVRFWDVVNRQRIALGGGDDLPEKYKFRYWGN